jgi:hypothetical protein
MNSIKSQADKYLKMEDLSGLGSPCSPRSSWHRDTGQLVLACNGILCSVETAETRCSCSQEKWPVPPLVYHLDQNSEQQERRYCYV